jgi:hypothetical protein
MSDKLVTYHSVNSPPHLQWLGYIWAEEGKLNISFMGPTEEFVKEKMREFWAKDKAVRDANRQKKEEQRRKAAAKKEEDKGPADAE